VRSGQTVLIHGAAGGVGSFGVQLRPRCARGRHGVAAQPRLPPRWARNRSSYGEGLVAAGREIVPAGSTSSSTSSAGRRSTRHPSFADGGVVASIATSAPAPSSAATTIWVRPTRRSWPSSPVSWRAATCTSRSPRPTRSTRRRRPTPPSRGPHPREDRRHGGARDRRGAGGAPARARGVRPEEAAEMSAGAGRENATGGGIRPRLGTGRQRDPGGGIRLDDVRRVPRVCRGPRPPAPPRTAARAPRRCCRSLLGQQLQQVSHAVASGRGRPARRGAAARAASPSSVEILRAIPPR
jgi:hypothetical protein